MSTPVTTVSLVAVPLTTPPTRQGLGGGHMMAAAMMPGSKGGQANNQGDAWFAREKFVDGIGNLNLAVTQLQQVVGLSNSTTTAVTGLLALTDGNLSFGNFSGGMDSGNLKTILIGGTSPASANTPFTLTHNLGKIPNGFIAVQKGVASDFYGTATTGSWTTTQLTISCDQSSVAYVILVLG